ncbi:MAG: imidazole glycerol phosphate synthase subunit HisH, partial [Lachnospiraceae bacterium]|nr:imidazole glycerol phosphate synthase subunit HisH [Lachnospiraceae bacterium]
GNVFACQFHPEKSSGAGMGILRNFCRICMGEG